MLLETKQFLLLKKHQKNLRIPSPDSFSSCLDPSSDISGRFHIFRGCLNKVLSFIIISQLQRYVSNYVWFGCSGLPNRVVWILFVRRRRFRKRHRRYPGFFISFNTSVWLIQKSRIPLTLVVMLIAMTLMIVADRGLYLRKWVYGKLAYQLLIIVFIHSWIFFILPLITKRYVFPYLSITILHCREASQNTVAQFLYLFKCMYLLVSAWQIRNGYPQLCIGNLLTHGYGVANMVFFKM